MCLHRSSLAVEDGTTLTGPTHAQLFALAGRGVEGAAEGPPSSEAGAVALDAVLSHLREEMPLAGEAVAEGARVEALSDALSHADQVLSRLTSHPRRRGTASGIHVALVRWPRLSLAHAGPGRAFLLRSGRLQDLAAGQARPRHAEEVGGSEDDVVHPAVRRLALEAGDVLLLASETLVELHGEASLTRTLQVARTAAEACRRLVETDSPAARAAVVARFLVGTSATEADEARAARPEPRAIEEESAVGDAGAPGDADPSPTA